MKGITNQNEVFPYNVSDVENVSGEWVTGLIRVLKLRNFLVATPDRYFPGMSVRGIVLARNPEVDEVVLRRSLSARKVLGNAATILVQVSLNGVERLRVETSRIKHEISVHTIPVV